MPRMRRSILPDYCYHITQRGNNKQRIFDDDNDCRLYLCLINDYAEKYAMRIIAFCLMNNHVHFIAKPEYPNSFARTFSALNMVYANYFNKKHKRVGHLWQGRYYSVPLDLAHFIAAVKYVERNPVRAKLVRFAWDWTWSSAQHHIGMHESILKLEDMSDYVEIRNWKLYLLNEDKREDLKIFRQNLKRGRKGRKKGTVPL